MIRFIVKEQDTLDIGPTTLRFDEIREAAKTVLIAIDASPTTCIGHFDATGQPRIESESQGKRKKKRKAKYANPSPTNEYLNVIEEMIDAAAAHGLTTRQAILEACISWLRLHPVK